MGKGGSVTVGYWYRVAYHAGIGIGPIDAFLEFRAGDKSAWTGNLTASGTININAPNLFGGEQDQGGIQSNVDVMFGEATQQPNTYLQQTFGSQVPAWRGLATLVFKGGRYGAMNPYPQKPSYKIQRIVKGWDNDACWYPEKAAIAADAISFTYDSQQRYRVELAGSGADYSDPNYDDSLWGIGPGAFGNKSYGADAPVIKTFIPYVYGETIWLRLHAGYSNVPVNVEIRHDDDATLWWNGEQIPLTFISGDPLNTNKSIATIPVSKIKQNNVAVLKVVDHSTDAITAAIQLSSNSATLMIMNPAHILYYAKTQQDMGREPTANMHDASFRTAADWYYNQGVGLCTEYDPAAESLDDFIARIEKVAGCSMSRSPVDGLWYLDVANGIYDRDSLPVLTDDDILDFSETPSLQDSAINSQSVEFFDPQQKETITTAPVQAMALIDAFGTIHNQVSYTEVPTNSLALRLADRDLRADVTPKRAFELTTTRRTYGWRVGTYFRLQSPRRGIADMVCILAEKSTGTLKSGAIKITASRDVYSMAAATFVDVEPGVDTRPPQIPVPIAQQQAFEAPYVVVCAILSRADLAALPADVGYLMAMATDPALSRDFTLMVSTGGDYAAAANGDWCATATVVEASVFDDTTFTLGAGVGLDEVAIGMPALWGSEIVRVDAIDAGTGAVTLGRSCADTVEVMHAAGERIWFYATEAAADRTEYTDGETIDVKLLTNTGSQQLAVDDATTVPVTFGGRASRPYPPGQMRINGQVAPTNISGDVTVTGVHRDRVQQADQLVDGEMAGIGPEQGTTYTVRYYINTALVHTDAGLMEPTSTYSPSGAGVMRVEFESARDGLASYQMHVREFAIGQPLLDESGALITTEDGQTIIMG